MPPTLANGKICYLEMPATDIVRSADFYKQKEIAVRLDASVASLDPQGRAVAMSDGSRVPFDALLLATGARVVRLDVPGADLPHV